LIAELNAEGVALRGPLPADGLFARWRGDEAILAIYHDQGLAPFKARFADRSCQISLGLPFLRTSPDHGTAYDLAGSGRADPGGVRAALQRAAQALP
jgi:4-hydroxy-L-threonine phosphate dehydrogenase PdxA